MDKKAMLGEVFIIQGMKCVSPPYLFFKNSDWYIIMTLTS
jgi:hypothetical protein